MAGLRALIAGFAAWVGGGLCFMAAAEPPPLEAYGANPELLEITISPDGDRYGLFRNIDGTPYLQVIDAQGNSVALMDASNVRARGSYFANNDTMVLFASQRERIFGYCGDFEYSAAMGFIIEKKKAYQLLKRTDLYPAQSGLGRIVGMSAYGQYACMPAL